MAWPLNDLDRETVIATYAQLAQGSAASVLRRYWFDCMRAEIANRSDDQVKRMEAERGLNAA